MSGSLIVGFMGCKCGCGKNNTDPLFAKQLETAFVSAGVPLTKDSINSGCRCEAHNKKVGGSPTSSHLTGHAADLSAIDTHTRHKLRDAMTLVGITRIGHGNGFMHVDNDPTKPQEQEWTY